MSRMAKGGSGRRRRGERVSFVSGVIFAACVLLGALTFGGCAGEGGGHDASTLEALAPETGCTSESYGGHIYWFCPALRNWSTAQSSCAAIGQNLARIDSRAENDFIWARIGLVTRWIGASDSVTEGNWRWTLGNQQFWSGTYLGGSTVDQLFTKWALLQPDNFLNQDCGQMNLDGTWSDQGCAALAGYVCESGVDLCPSDPHKVSPGVCGCGVPDVDTDADGVLDCQDKCPNDATKIEPGDCGCRDVPRPTGTSCNDGLCSANTTCNGSGVCGNPASCPAPDGTCRYGVSRNKYYWFCDNDRVFADARARCQSVGMDLPIVDDALEDAFITAGIREHSFIGGSDQAVEGSWIWLPNGNQFWSGGPSGSPVNASYTNWESGQPSDGLFGQDCMVKDPPAGNGKWETRPCTDADAFACEGTPPPRRLELQTNPFLDRVAQAANLIGSTGLTDNQNAQPGQEACGAGLDLVTVQSSDMEYTPTLKYPPPPTQTDPTKPNCRVQYHECTDDDANTDLDSPSEATLNQAPDPATTCEAIADRAIEQCGIDPTTIDYSADGLCTTHAQCVGRGFVCALVCSDASCTTQEYRCAFPKPGCYGIPEQSNCASATECPETDHTGISDPDVAQNDMLDHPPGDIDQKSAPPSDVSNPTKNTLPPYPAVNACILDPGPVLQLPPQDETREVNVGNEKWGLFITPTVKWGAKVTPKPLLAESSIQANGEVGFKVGAYVWKKEVSIIDVDAKAEVTDSCTVQFDREVSVLGVHIDPGQEAKDVKAPGYSSGTCTTAADGRIKLVKSLKQAEVNAVAVKEYYEIHGATIALCNSVKAALNYPLDYDCTTPQHLQDAVDYWFNQYAGYHAQLVTNQTDFSSGRQDVVSKLPGLRLPVFDDHRRFTAADTSFTYPVGPATVTVEIEIGGSWGASGALQFDWSPSPTGLTADAEIQPTAEATAFAYAGIGFGPVSFGVSGELLLIGAQSPLVAEVALEQVKSPDTRSHQYTDELGLLTSPNFPPTKSQWTATFSYGARPDLSLLDGKVNLEARVDLFFFTKRFRKKLANWKGVHKTYNFVATSSGDTLDGAPDFGVLGDDIPYLDPVTLHQLRQPSSPDVNYSTAPSMVFDCDPIR